MAIPGTLLQLAKSSPKIQQIKQMYNTVKMAQNPQLVMNQLMMNNPQLKQVMDLVNQNGGDIGKTIRTVAEQNGISTQDIMKLLE